MNSPVGFFVFRKLVGTNHESRFPMKNRKAKIANKINTAKEENYKLQKLGVINRSRTWSRYDNSNRKTEKDQLYKKFKNGDYE